MARNTKSTSQRRTSSASTKPSSPSSPTAAKLSAGLHRYDGVEEIAGGEAPRAEETTSRKSVNGHRRTATTSVLEDGSRRRSSTPTTRRTSNQLPAAGVRLRLCPLLI